MRGKNVVYEPLYSVGKIVKRDRVITCSFCKKELSEIVIYQESDKELFHPKCYQDFNFFEKDLCQVFDYL